MQEFFAKHRIRPQKIAIAVSGGADSLALVLMTKEELGVFGYEIVALTVNHGLRPSAAQEAEYVANIMKQHGIEHHILTWQGTKPVTNVEDTARKARYLLLTEWCHQHNIGVLLTAHHQNDQAETFLIRLARGSGLDGLCCIREISQNNGITILRPLLQTPPQQLRDFLQQRHIEWVEDESNTDSQYLRNRIRKFLPLLTAQTGIDAKCLAETAFRLQSAEEYIEQQLQQAIQADVHFLAGNVAYFKHTLFLQWPQEIRFRLIAELCRQTYIPRAESVLNVIAAIAKLPFKGQTLGGKEIFCAYKNIWIVPELCAKRKASRDAWKNFIENHKQYEFLKIPHKARIAILESEEKNLDL